MHTIIEWELAIGGCTHLRVLRDLAQLQESRIKSFRNVQFLSYLANFYTGCFKFSSICFQGSRKLSSRQQIQKFWKEKKCILPWEIPLWKSKKKRS